MLPLFNFRVVKLFDPTAIQAHQVVVVLALIDFINRLAGLEIAAVQQAGLLKLREHPVHRGQTDVGAVFQEHPKHILGGHVALFASLEDLEDLQPWQGGLQACAFKFVDVAHGEVLREDIPLPAGKPEGRRRRVAPVRSGTLPLQWSIISLHPPTMSALSAKNRQRIQTVLTVLACAGLTACGSIKGMTSGLGDSKINPVNWITPYRMEVVQGNFVSKEQVELLKPGMPRVQVRDLLGTPLMASVFHADRWDYVFTLKRQGAEPQALRLTVFFKGDALDRFEGDEMPSESDFVARLDSRRKLGKVPVLELTPEQLEASEKKKPATSVAPVAVPPAAASAASYPPLESPAR